MIQAVSALVARTLRPLRLRGGPLRWNVSALDPPFMALLLSLSVQVGVTATNLATGILTARLLGSEGRGVFAALTTWPQLLAMLAISELGSAIIVRLRKSPERAPGLTAAVFMIGGVSAVIAIVFGAAVLPLFMMQYGSAVTLMAQICLVSTVVNAMQMLMNQTCVGLGAFRLFNIGLILPQALYLVSLLLALLLAPLTPLAATIALLVGGTLVPFALMLPTFLRLARPSFDAGVREVKRILSYAGRAAPMDAVCTLYLYMDRLVLIPLLPARELGLYAVAYSFSRLVQLALPAITSVILSNMSGRDVTEAKELHDRAYRFLLPVLIAASAALWLVGEALLGLIYGAEFALAGSIFRLLVIEAALGVLVQVTMQFFLAADRPGLTSAIQVGTLIGSLALIVALVHAFGAAGAAMGLLLAAFARLVLLQAVMRLVLKLPAQRLVLDGGDIAYLKKLLRGSNA